VLRHAVNDVAAIAATPPRNFRRFNSLMSSRSRLPCGLQCLARRTTSSRAGGFGLANAITAGRHLGGG
jgi:hypothetical protein